jgi:hypothetical protein
MCDQAQVQVSAVRALALASALAAAAVPAVRAATVEAGSQGNLLVVHVTNTDPQLPLTSQFEFEHIPSWVTRAVPRLQTTVPATLMPGQSGDAAFVFDVSIVAPGASDSLVITLRKGPDDSTNVALPLTVAAPAPLAHDVRVVFRADFNAAYLPAAGGTVAALVDGMTGNPLADDGVAPDVAAGDRVYTGSMLFPGGGPTRHRYQLLLDGIPECDTATAGDRRVFTVDPFFDAAGNPQALPVAAFGQCATTGVGPWIAPPVAVLELRAAPNPFTQRTRVEFRVPRAARVRLLFYDVAGRRLRTLDLGPRLPGPQVATWDGRDEAGVALRPGSYLCALSLDGRLEGARRVVILR